MVYIHSWQDFQDAAEGLYEKAPNTTRYCIKWKSSEGKLVLKITDNADCIKFKTNSSIFLNRFESLNLHLMQKMQNKQRQQEPPQITSTPIPQVASVTSPDAERAGSVPPQASSALPSAGPAAGGVKKKKPKKKK